MKDTYKLVLNYIHLMRFHKPVGIFLLLWPTLTAVWLGASGWPAVSIIVIFSVGVIVMRAAGCTMNDIADRHVDRHVARTKQRPLAQQVITTKQAFILFISLIVIAMGLVLQLNRQTQLLAVVALGLAVVYPFVKRVSHFPQVVLGAAFGWAIPMAFAAQQERISWVGWWFFIAMLLWSVIYDTQYAMVDKADDLKIGVKSTAIAFGKHDRAILLGLQVVVSGMLIGLGYGLRFGVGYFIACAIVCGLFLYQQYLIKDRDPTLCFRAFLNNQFVGLSLFLGVVCEFF